MILLGTYTAYEILKFWLPVVSAFSLVIKAYFSMKKSIGAWANRLLDNHLSHIETATASTEQETKETNKILKEVSGQNVALYNTVTDHQEKSLRVWDSVTKTLAILEDRTRVTRRPRRKR